MILAPPKSALFPDFGSFLTYAESVRSDKATELGIPNIPTPKQYDNGFRWYKGLYLPICKEFGKVPLSSGFRCKALNTAVNGSKTSAHMDFLAGDIDGDKIDPALNKAIYAWCRANRGTLGYDQLITEFPDKNGRPSWVHIAYRAVGYQRKMGMRAVKKDGRVFYMYE